MTAPVLLAVEDHLILSYNFGNLHNGSVWIYAGSFIGYYNEELQTLLFQRPKMKTDVLKKAYRRLGTFPKTNVSDG